MQPCAAKDRHGSPPAHTQSTEASERQHTLSAPAEVACVLTAAAAAAVAAALAPPGAAVLQRAVALLLLPLLLGLPRLQLKRRCPAGPLAGA
jgi:hypothetical protein